MALSDVSNILWRERQLLELLVFKLEEEQLVLAAGRSRWLAYATREVENVLGEIKRIELERAVRSPTRVASSVCRDRRRCASSRVSPPSPWDGIFAEHRRAAHARAGDRLDHEVEPRSLAARPPGRARSDRGDGRDRHRRVRRARNAARPFARVADRRRGDLMSDFSGLRLALSALQAQQRSVNVAAQNVANANTPGLHAPGRQPRERRRAGHARRATRRSRATARA